MNIVEALKLSNKVRRESWNSFIHFDNIDTRGLLSVNKEDLIAYDWEPIIEKKTVTKKFYQAVLCLPGEKESNYYIVERLFESPEKAESYAKDHDFKLVRFLSENPIEVEVEE